MKKAYLALGTNIEPRLQHLDEAMKVLTEYDEVKVRAVSSIYETAPVGYTDQDSFLNMVIEVDTSLSSIKLLDLCQSIENDLGRQRTIRFGPRTIDVDVLVYNQDVIDTERLTIPHPRMHERAFVLIPLSEIAPNLVIPTKEQNVKDLINELSEVDIRDVVKWKRDE